jgi:hypothetical protein
MLFPNLGPAYFDEEDRAILNRMEAFYQQSITANQAFWYEADTDTRFYSGDATLWQNFYGNVPSSTKRVFNFNRIRRIISMIEGHQRKNRKSTIIIPQENGDEDTADQYTKLMLWSDQQDNVLETISEAFLGALITGMSFLQVWIDYSKDPINGDLKVDTRSYNYVLMDPFFKKGDMSDCNEMWIRTYVTKKQCYMLLPGKEDKIDSLQSSGYRDGKFNFSPESYNFNIQNLMTYDEYYYKDYRKQTLLVDTETGESTEWNGTSEDLKTFLMFSPTLTTITSDIPTVKVAIVVQGKVFYNGVNPMGIDIFPLVPVFGYYTPELPYYPWRIQGVTRGLRDAQFLYNHRKILELDILESQLNSGYIVKENTVINTKDLYKTGQGQVLTLKDDAQMTDIQQIQAPQIPPSMLQISDAMANEIQQISGVSEENMGMAVNDVAGFLSMLRQNAGLTSLQRVFDQLDRSQRILGKLRLNLMQINWTPGKVKRIIGEEPTEQFYNRKFGKYDAAVEDGLNTTTQRQMQFAQMLQLKEVGVPITNEDLLESCTLQGKKKIIENMQKQQQQMQQQQQQQMELEQQQIQMNMQETQARIEMTRASATAAEGLGIERLSRVAENQAMVDERKAKADASRDTGILNLVKAVKELDTIDIDQAHKVIQFINMINAQSAQDSMENEAKTQQFMQQNQKQLQSNMPQQSDSNMTNNQ